jgi:hypothetical protein
MRRLPYLLSLVFFPLLGACDPDLTVAAKPGADAASEVGVDPGPGPVTPNDDGGTGDGGTGDDGGTTEEDSGSSVTTHTIDGDNDFKPSEKFVTSSTGNGYEGFIAWDAKNLYVGMAGNDIGNGASTTKWILIYLDGGTSTTTTGQTYGGQQPTLPFGASFHIGYRTDLSFVNKHAWDGNAWVDATATLIPVPSAQRKNGFFEVAIPRAAIGNPSTVKIHVNMINEASGSEWTYSAMPSTSLTDGPDPNYGKYFSFDLSDTTKAPNQYTPQ